MIEISKDEKFTMVHDCVMALKECKTGRFTELRKIVLSKLMFKYDNFNKLKEVHTHKKGTYHFYFNQSQLAAEMGKDKKDINRAMKWLQTEGYITYFSAPKPGYIWKASFVTMNEKFINSKIGSESKISTPDNTKEIDNNSIPTDIEVNTEQFSPFIESIEHIPTATHEKVNQKKIFGKKELEIYLSNNKMVHFDNISSKGYKPEIPEYENLVNSIWLWYNTSEDNYREAVINELSKIYEDDDEYDLYAKKVVAKINNSIQTENHKQENRVEEKEQFPFIESVEQIPSINPEKNQQPKTVGKNKQLPVIEKNKQTSNPNGITGRPQKRIKFGKEKLESYLSNDELVPFCVMSGKGYGVNKNKPEYKKLVSYIWQWCETSKSPKNKEYTAYIHQTLSEICRDNKEEYNSYIDKINAKAKVHNYNLELQKL